MRVGLLLGGKINAIRAPADESGIFIESFGQHPGRASVGIHHRDFHIRIKKVFEPPVVL